MKLNHARYRINILSLIEKEYHDTMHDSTILQEMCIWICILSDHIAVLCEIRKAAVICNP